MILELGHLGIVAKLYVPWQWTSQSRGGDGGQKASFYVYSQCALCDAGEELVDLGWTSLCSPYCNAGYVPMPGFQCWRADSNGAIYIPPQGIYGRDGRVPNKCFNGGGELMK